MNILLIIGWVLCSLISCSLAYIRYHSERTGSRNFEVFRIDIYFAIFAGPLSLLLEVLIFLKYLIDSVLIKLRLDK
jgi:hypothetical protein